MNNLSIIMTVLITQPKNSLVLRWFQEIRGVHWDSGDIRRMSGLSKEFPGGEIQGNTCMSPSPDCISNAVQSVVESWDEVFEVYVGKASDDDSCTDNAATEDCETTEVLETIAQFRNLRVILIQHHQRQSAAPRGLVCNDSEVVCMDFSSRDHPAHDDHLCLVRFNHMDIREKRTRVKKQQSDF